MANKKVNKESTNKDTSTHTPLISETHPVQPVVENKPKVTKPRVTKAKKDAEPKSESTPETTSEVVQEESKPTKKASSSKTKKIVKSESEVKSEPTPEVKLETIVEEKPLPSIEESKPVKKTTKPKAKKTDEKKKEEPVTTPTPVSVPEPAPVQKMKYPEDGYCYMIIQEFPINNACYVIGSKPYGKVWFRYQDVLEQYANIMVDWQIDYDNNEIINSDKPRIVKIKIE
jgi:hypothetical protein